MRRTTVAKFNVDPKDGINYIISQGLLREMPVDVSTFLATEPGLSKRKIGEYFGKDREFNRKVFESFLLHLDFQGLSLDEALRRMVLKFRMPGEAQQIDRIMEMFARRFHAENEGIFSCADTAYILAFSLMMLNTDLFNRSLKESEKMTCDQFCNNNRGIDQGEDLPRGMLEDMYGRIKNEEIRMDEGDMFESEVITFVAPTASGWLKKKGAGTFGGWKRHWFVLADGVLYYFFAPQDDAPRCIIPLENVNITPLGKSDISISRCDDKDYVKSVKMMDDGSMEQGSHKVCETCYVSSRGSCSSKHPKFFFHSLSNAKSAGFCAPRGASEGEGALDKRT